MMQIGDKRKKNFENRNTFKIIGTNSFGYAHWRNFVSLPFAKYKFKKCYDLYKFLDWAYFKTNNKSNYYLLNTNSDLNINPVSFYHFFNAVSFGRKPWITSFETDIPRWGYHNPEKKNEKGVKLIAGSYCKAIIAISESTALHQQARMDQHFPAFKDDVLSKMLVIHPPQVLHIKEYGQKNLDRDFVVFTIIGNEFFRKGGSELLRVFDNLLKKKYPLKLNIISKLEHGDYAKKSTREDFDNALKIIAKYPENIFHYSKIDNAKVIDMLNRSHVGLLPTWADTYGYSILEAQASGCPVITTNVRALPEINNDETGWIIPVAKNLLGDAIMSTPQERKVFSDNLIEQLLYVIKDIVHHPDQIEVKGKNSIGRIAKHHNPIQSANRLEKIYDSILNIQPSAPKLKIKSKQVFHS
jgi:glycosyltransferase involved in cell wall biosynthesis